jgi:beta-phosphoglucomutase
MDSVLVDANPLHYQVMKSAIKEVTNIDLDVRNFYLLEGMPVAEMALELFKLKGYLSESRNISENNVQRSETVAKRKKEIFREMKIIPKSYDGIRELIVDGLSNCLRAVVTGAAKQEVDMIVDKIFTNYGFDLIVNGDEFEGKGSLILSHLEQHCKG